MPMVAPLAGVWIEMAQLRDSMDYILVAPLAGVWIEILATLACAPIEQSRSPCGSVD